MLPTLNTAAARVLQRTVTCLKTKPVPPSLLAPLTHITKQEYISLPIAVCAGGALAAYGGYAYLRNHLNPLQSRPLKQVMNQTTMIGQSIINNNNNMNDVNQNALEFLHNHSPPPINKEIQSHIENMRAETIHKIKQRFGFQFLSGNLYFRPIVLPLDSTQTGEMDTVQLMHEFGICHAFWILNAGPTDFLLDFVQEGIRFEMIENITEVIHDSGDHNHNNDNDMHHHIIPCFPSAVALGVNSHHLADWIELQSKTKLDSYNLQTNHCLHFVHRFGETFLTEKFQHPGAAHTPQSPHSYKHEMDNQLLLQWTSNIIRQRQKHQ